MFARVAAAAPLAVDRVGVGVRGCRPCACSMPSPPAARSRPADATSTEIEWATNVDWAKGKHAVRAGALVEGGRYRSDSRTNYLGTYTFASLADYDAAAGHLHAADRRSARPVLAVAGGPLRAGRLARAQEPDAQRGSARRSCRRISDDAGTSRRAPASPGRHSARQNHGPRRRRNLLRLARRGHVRADASRRRREAAGSRDSKPRLSRIRSAGGADQQVLPTSKYMLAGNLVMPKRAMRQRRHQPAALADARRQRELQPHGRHQPAARPQHQCAAGRWQPSGSGARQRHPGRIHRSHARRVAQCRSQLQRSDAGGRWSSRTTR